jgi:hypothetical protein
MPTTLTNDSRSKGGKATQEMYRKNPQKLEELKRRLSEGRKRKAERMKLAEALLNKVEQAENLLDKVESGDPKALELL